MNRNVMLEMLYLERQRGNTNIPFEKTVAGNHYYQHTLPELINAIEHLATSLDRLNIVEINEKDQKELAKNIALMLHVSSVNIHFPQMVEGHRFYQRLPALIKVLNEINTKIEKD